MIRELFAAIFRRARSNRPSIGSDAWEIDPPREFPVFLRSLPVLLDADSILYLEDSGTPPSIEEFLRDHGTTSKARIPGGTLFPKPNVFHVPMSVENLDGLASLLESTDTASIPTHVHVYDDSGLALQWYDACAGDPILIRSSVDVERVSAFCEAVGSGWRRPS